MTSSASHPGLTNAAAVEQQAALAEFDIVGFHYLRQHPGCFMINGFLYLLTTDYDNAPCRINPLRFLRGRIALTPHKK